MVYVKGNDPGFALRQLRQMRGFSSQACTRIKDMVTRLRKEQMRRDLRGLALDLKQAAPEAFQS